MKYFILQIAMLSCTALVGQETNGHDSLASDHHIFMKSGYGGPAVIFSTFEKKFGVMVGGYSAFRLTEQFSIGGGGYSLVNDLKVPINDSVNLFLEFGYGGIMIAYELFPESTAHPYCTVLIGGGGFDLKNRNGSTTSGTGFFIIEPEIGVEIKLAKFMKLRLSGDYRLTTGFKTEFLKAEEIRYAGGKVGLIFGWFGD